MYSEGRTAKIVKLGLAVIIVSMVLFVFVDLLEGPFYSLSTKTWPPKRRGDRLIGRIEGVVKHADSATSTMRVASGFLGLASLSLVVTPETRIAVNGKLGGVADLDRGQLVRVAYAILPERLLAWRVDVLDRSSQRSEAVVPAATDGDATVNEEESSPARPPRPAPAADPPRTPVLSAPTSPRSASPSAVPRDGRTTAPATKRPVPSPISPPQPAAQDTGRPVPVTSAPAPAESTPGAPQAGDGALPPKAERLQLPTRPTEAP